MPETPKKRDSVGGKPRKRASRHSSQRKSSERTKTSGGNRTKTQARQKKRNQTEAENEQPDVGNVQPDVETLWERYRVAIVSAIIGVLLAGWAQPVRNWFLGAADSGRDAVRRVINYDAGKVDDLKEKVQDRPYWQESPTFLGKSLDYLTTYDSPGKPLVLSTEGGYGDPGFRVETVDRVVTQAPEYDGIPFILVGYQSGPRTDLGGGDELLDLVSDEVTIRGDDPANQISLGIGSGLSDGFNASPSGIVAVAGVVTAYGQAQARDNPVGAPTAFFTVLESFEVGSKVTTLRHAAVLMR